MTQCENWRGLAGSHPLQSPRMKGSEKMIEMIAMLCATIVITMVKKQKIPVFGQLTLTGEKALNWMKNGDEICVRTIWFCSVNALSDWNVPEWAKDKGICALIFPVNIFENPMFITQKSVLKVLEAQCVLWEEAGAECKIIGTKLQGQKMQMHFPEDGPSMKFTRPENCPTYAPYEVTILE